MRGAHLHVMHFHINPVQQLVGYFLLLRCYLINSGVGAPQPTQSRGRCYVTISESKLILLLTKTWCLRGESHWSQCITLKVDPNLWWAKISKPPAHIIRNNLFQSHLAHFTVPKHSVILPPQQSISYNYWHAKHTTDLMTGLNCSADYSAVVSLMWIFMWLNLRCNHILVIGLAGPSWCVWLLCALASALWLFL